MLLSVDCRFLMFIPAALTKPVILHSYHPQPSKLQKDKEFNSNLRDGLLLCSDLLHPIATGGMFLFPERRLIQYDCGK